MDFILKKKLKFYTKEFLKIFNITIIAFGLIIAIILIKYKPMYKVSISGEKLGYIEMVTEGEKGILSKETTYKIKKAFPDHYNSVMLMNELRTYNGLIPETKNYIESINKIKV